MNLFSPFSEQTTANCFCILPFLDAILATLIYSHSAFSFSTFASNRSATNCSYLIIGSLGQRCRNIMKTKEKQKALKCMGIKAYMHQCWLNMTTTEGIQRDKCFYC